MVAETITFEDGHYSVGLPWKPRTMTYQIISQWPCTVCKTQRNNSRNPQNLPKLTVMYLSRTKIDNTSARSYQKKKSRIKYGIYRTFQFRGQINPQQRSELYLMHLQNVRKFLLLNDFLLQGPKLQNDLFAVSL